MSAFESVASHLFNIRLNGKHYEIVFEEDDFNDEQAINPIKTKLSALKLFVGDKLSIKCNKRKKNTVLDNYGEMLIY